MLNVVNQLFKIYFRVNKLHLCKPLIRAIEQSSLKDRSDHMSLNLKALKWQEEMPIRKDT